MYLRSVQTFRHLDASKDGKLDKKELGEKALRQIDQNQDGFVDAEELWRALQRPKVDGSEGARRIDAALLGLQDHVDEPWRSENDRDVEAERAGNKAALWTLGAGLVAAIVVALCGLAVAAAIVFCAACVAAPIARFTTQFLASREGFDADAAREELRAGVAQATEASPEPAKWPSEQL